MSSKKEERLAKRKEKNLTPQHIKQDEFQLYRSNLLNPLLNELVSQNRLGSLQEARDNKDQIKFSGLYKVEQYTKDLKTALESIPSYTYTSYSGDMIAGVQIHQSAPVTGLKVHIAKPSSIDLVGSYLQGTAIIPSYNIDLNITLPETFLVEKDFQDYTYFDKKAMYVAAVATHLKHFDDLRFANLHITHEVHDQLKPIIIIQPSIAMDIDTLLSNVSNGDVKRPSGQNDSTISLSKPSGLLGKFRFILHVVPPINRIPLRKLAPNRNNVKMIEQQRWYDISNDESNQKDKMMTMFPGQTSFLQGNGGKLTQTELSSHLNETIVIPNVAPTPDYNHAVIHDLLSTSQHYIFMTLLGESTLMQNIIIAIKIWLKLRGLYIDSCPTSSSLDTDTIYQQSSQINPLLTQKYQQLLSKTHSLQQNDAFTQILSKTNVHFNYRHHFMHHSMGLAGWQVTYLVVNLFLQRKISQANNLQHGLDTFFRFMLLHYSDNETTPPTHTFLPNQRTILNTTHDHNYITTPLVLPPDYNDSISINTLQQAQNDYTSLYSSSQLTPTSLFHAFDILMIDCNGIFNVLYQTTSQTWYHVQAHALLSLKLTYGNNAGSLLSHDVTPQLLSGNLSLHLKHSQLAPQTDQDIFIALYMTKLTSTKHSATNNSIFSHKDSQDGDMLDFDQYLQEIHSLYMKEINQLCDLGYYCDGVLKTSLPHQSSTKSTLSPFQLGDKLSQYDQTIQHKYLNTLQKYGQYNEDLSLLQFDNVYDVTLPISYIPYYPALSAHLYTKRQLLLAQNVTHGKKSSKVKGLKASSQLISDAQLMAENLYKVGMISDQALPIVILSNTPSANDNGVNFVATNGMLKKLQQTTHGVEQSTEARLIDGDIVEYISNMYLPTIPMYFGITYRIQHILSHSLMNRVYALFVEPQLNTTHTSFIWRVNVKLNPIEAARSLDKGPHAEQIQRCKDWKAWWGSNKSELRRFPDGSIIEVILWDYRTNNLLSSAGAINGDLNMNYNHGTAGLQLPNEQIPFHIAQYILPLHLFTTNTHTSQDIIYTNKCIVSTPTHPLGAFVQQKDIQALFSHFQTHLESSVIIPDPYHVLPTSHSVSSIKKDPFVSISLPIALSLNKSFKMFQTLLKEHLTDTLPLGIDNIESSSPFLRGTAPFNPQPHYFSENITKEQVNHFFSALSPNASHELKQIDTSNIYEPINIVLTLAHSNKWPTNDLLALNRIKAAFYLRLATALNEFKDKSTKSSASDAVTNDKRKNKNHNKEPVDDNLNNSLQELGQVYTQVTPYYIDVYVAGYVYRCRIANSHEINLFRTQSANGQTLSPLILGDGNIRSIEREYVYRPQHHIMMKQATQEFTIIPLLTKFLSRWLSAHYFSQYINNNIELCELLVASIFITSAPFTIPTTFTAGLVRLLYRLSQFDFLSKPLILPTIEFSMSSDAEAKLEQQKFTKLNNKSMQQQHAPLCINHQQSFTYYHQEYNSDINIDQYPSIYHEFSSKKVTHQQRPLVYIVTSYDQLSKAWTMRPANQFFYQDHFNLLIQSLTKSNQDIENDHNNFSSRFIPQIRSQLLSSSNPMDNTNDDDIDDDDDDDVLVNLFYKELQEKDEKRNILQEYYFSRIDHGDTQLLTSNTTQLITNISYDDLFSFQFFTQQALLSINTLLHFSSNAFSYIPIHHQILSPPSPSGSINAIFQTTQWALKAPVQWTFQHYLGLFKPQLQQFDAFIIIKPNAFTIDQIQRSLWLFTSKTDENDDEEHDYHSFMNRAAFLHVAAQSHQLSANNTRGNKNQRAEGSIGPELPQNLKNQITDPLFVGHNYIQSYLNELRARFGQFASFYCDTYGSRVIAIKFHPFITTSKNVTEYKSSATETMTLESVRDLFLKHVQQRKEKSMTRVTGTYTPHIQHPLQNDLHLTSSVLFSFDPLSTTRSNKRTQLVPNLIDLLSQMAQVGDGIVQNVFDSYDEFSQNVYF